MVMVGILHHVTSPANLFSAVTSTRGQFELQADTRVLHRVRRLPRVLTQDFCAASDCAVKSVYDGGRRGAARGMMLGIGVVGGRHGAACAEHMMLGISHEVVAIGAARWSTMS